MPDQVIDAPPKDAPAAAWHDARVSPTPRHRTAAVSAVSGASVTPDADRCIGPLTAELQDGRHLSQEDPMETPGSTM